MDRWLAVWRRLRVWILYCVPVLAISLPWLWPGFILTLDMAFTPRLPIPAEVSNDFALYASLHWLNLLLPGDAIQKILLLMSFLLMGVGAHRLLWQLRPTTMPGALWQWGCFAAGLLYMINPFVYDRLMAGQWAVLLGYALLPFFACALLRFVEQPGPRTTAILAVYTLLESIVSIHAIGNMAVLVLAGASYALWYYRKDSKHLLYIGRYALLAGGIILLASSYWLAPLLRGQGTTAAAVRSFGHDGTAFSTVGNGVVGQIANVIRLQGFWAEQERLFILPQQVMPAWGVLMLILWLVMLAGGIWWWRRSRIMVLVWSAVLVAGAILASGALQSWLAHVVPFFAGYREPQKFAALVALAYAIFAGCGLVALAHRAGQWAPLTRFIILALPLLITPCLLFGAAGQLQPRQYPADWYTMNGRLSELPGKGSVLFLPWHNYMSFGFAGRIIGNPAERFFERPIIVGNNPEFKDARPVRDESAKRQISKLLSVAAAGQNLGAQLRQHDIQYVLLAKELDYRDYDYLNQQRDLQLVQETPTLKLYKNTAYDK